MKTLFTKKTISKALGIACVAGSALLLSCSSDDSSNSVSTKKQFITSYAKMVDFSYQNVLAHMKNLKTDINAFTKNPTQAGLDKAKETWKRAREPYLQTEVYRFYAGPIDDANGPEGLINAWPLDECHIDYVVGAAKVCAKGNIISGSMALTKEYLRNNNEKADGKTNAKAIITGFHAIEFMLWGQDLPEYTDKPGQRPYTDYTTKDGAARRKQYLDLLVDVMIEDMTKVANQWKDGGAYRKTFLALPENEAILKISTGMGRLTKGELASERLAAAVKSGDQEDEHSCFSDNTHRDHRMNLQGVINIIKGSFYSKNVDGTSTSFVGNKGLKDVVAEINKATADDLLSKYQAALKDIEAIKIPFDQAIKTDVPKINTAVNNLGVAATALQKATTAIGVKNVPVELAAE